MLEQTGHLCGRHGGINMSINQIQLLDYIIRPATDKAGFHSASSDILLLGTCEMESSSGKYLKQINGPAIGIFQMEPFTHDSLINHELSKITRDKIFYASYLSTRMMMRADTMSWNFYYATLMARAKYLTKREPLPKHNDYKGMAEYYKLHYNTPLGKSTIEKSEEVFKNIISDFT